MVSPEGIVPVQAGPKGEAGVPGFLVVSGCGWWPELDGVRPRPAIPYLVY